MQDLDLQAVFQRMNLIATELQEEEVTKTRQPPIGNIWNKFPHTVRDQAHSRGEEARLEIKGKTPNSTAHMQGSRPNHPVGSALPSSAHRSAISFSSDC
jgi:hypothetical protein